MSSQQIIYQIGWMFILAAYAFFIILITKKIYNYMIKKQFKESIAVYYNRKFIHIFAGGVVVLIVPFVFSSPIFPLLSGLIMAVIALAAHKRGNTFYWFQTSNNFNDVSFCFMWGIAIFILWQILGNPWIAIIPPAFIAFGDGITGIIRNLAFKERKKHPIGNIYMMGVCIPIGYYFTVNSNIYGLAFWGVLAAIVASFFERYEFGIIDDNVLIAGSATIILYLGSIIGPIF
jgi:phytol kinase